MKKIPKLVALAATLLLPCASAFADDAYDHLTGSITDYGRYVTTFTFTNNTTNQTSTMAGTGSGSHDVYVDRLTTEINVTAGDKITLTTTGAGTWIHCYLYIDYDNDGTFTYDFEDNSESATSTCHKVTANSELVTFNMLNRTGSESVFYNSLGANMGTSGNGSANGPSPALPSFTIKNDLATGKYRARFMLYYNTLDPTGTSIIPGNNPFNCAGVGGAIYDFYFNVTGLSDEPTVSFTQPSNGTIEVKANGSTVSSGDTVAENDEITVTATPSSDDYYCSSVTVNGTQLDWQKDGIYTFSAADGANNIVATFAEKYAHVTGSTNTNTETEGNSRYRWITDIYLTGDKSANGSISTGLTSYIHDAWVDKTTEVIQVKAGETLTLRQKSNEKGYGMGTYLFIDYDQNYQFDYESALDYYQKGTQTLNKTNELVTFNADRFATSGTVFYNSKGETVTSLAPASWLLSTVASEAIPEFIIPEDLPVGQYRARFMLDYSSMDPTGGGHVVAWNGGIVDFTIEVVEDAVSEGVVTITAPSTEEGTIEVVKTDSDEKVNTGVTLASGTKLKITVTPTDEYLLDGVTATYEDKTTGTVTADATDANVFYYTISDKDVSIAAQFTKKSDKKFSVTITTPSNGSIKVLDSNNEEIADPTSITYGSQITIVATPDDGYLFSSLSVDGTEVATSATSTTEGTYTIASLTQNLTASATFTEKWAHYTGAITTSSTNNRHISTIDFYSKDNEKIGYISVGVTSSTRDVYQPQLSQSITVSPGDEITAYGWAANQFFYMAEYLYIDYDNDGIFKPLLNDDNSKVIEGSELVTYNYYNGYKSDGTAQSGANFNTYSSFTNAGENTQAFLPSFTIPSDLAYGKYRARFKVDYDNIDPYGNTSSGNHIKDNNGEIIDFYIEILGTRDVTVTKAENQKDVEYGTVSIVKVGSTDVDATDTANTKETVTAVATPSTVLTDEKGNTREVKFMCWTDENGKIISDASEYTYSGNDAANLVAHFGYQVNIVPVGPSNCKVTLTKKNKSTDAQSAPAYIADNDGVISTLSTTKTIEIATITPTEGEDIDEITLKAGEGTVLEAGETYVLSAESTDQANSIISVYVRNETTKKNTTEKTYVTDSTTNNSTTYSYTQEITLNDPTNINVTFYGVATGVEDVAVDGESAAEYFNLNGVRMDGDNLAPGVYLVRRGTTVTKQVIK